MNCPYQKQMSCGTRGVSDLSAGWGILLSVLTGAAKGCAIRLSAYIENVLVNRRLVDLSA